MHLYDESWEIIIKETDISIVRGHWIGLLDWMTG